MEGIEGRFEIIKKRINMTTNNRATIMMRQAPMTVHEWMHKGIETIDGIFGEGYAEKHPELLGDFLKACGSDQEAMATLNLAEIHESKSDTFEVVK